MYSTKEIIAKEILTSTITVGEAAFTVQSYIKARKDRDIVINLEKGLNNMNDLQKNLLLEDQFALLKRAFEMARSWFLDNKALIPN